MNIRFARCCPSTGPSVTWVAHVARLARMLKRRRL